MEHSLDELRDLIETLRKGEVGEFEYEDETIRLRISMGRLQVQESPPARVVETATSSPSAAMASVATEASPSDIVFVTSPFVGTFYRAPSPEAVPFVQPGQSIEKGQALCIVEAMKLMNEIESDVAGTLLEIMAENGASVEFGQRLFKIRKGKAS